MYISKTSEKLTMKDLKSCIQHIRCKKILETVEDQEREEYLIEFNR